ncbi:MAG: hypothetical protein OXI56_07835 [bacterium]|nr:hypothetical protein [bacterium]MDE0601687.1 hypothetical protein [bacterium]
MSVPRVLKVWGCGVLLASVLAQNLTAWAAPPSHSEGVCTVSAAVDEETDEVYPVTSCIHTDRQGSSYTPSFGRLDLQISSRGCFYMGTRPTQWVFLELHRNGDLTYGWAPNGRPGGHRVVGTAPRCSWTGVEREEIEGYVWSEIGDYTHQAPQVSFNPAYPRGLVGIETFAALGTPAPWVYVSTSPYTGRSLRAEVKVSQARIDWDDGPAQVFGEALHTRLTGYPDGVASHTYQTKSCDQDGPRCRTGIGAYEIVTSFVWSGWYAVGSGMKTLRIPSTYSTDAYPVTELISLVVG